MHTDIYFSFMRAALALLPAVISKLISPHGPHLKCLQSLLVGARSHSRCGTTHKTQFLISHLRPAPDEPRGGAELMPDLDTSEEWQKIELLAARVISPSNGHPYRWFECNSSSKQNHKFSLSVVKIHALERTFLFRGELFKRGRFICPTVLA